MKVILLVDVPKVGRAGKQVDVKDGFARNYLLPEKLAEMAGTPAARQILTKKKLSQEAVQTERRQSKEKFENLEGKKVVYKVKVNRQGHPYRAITSKDIAKSLNIDSKFVKSEPFKRPGIFEVKVERGTDVSKVVVEIVPEK